MRLDNNKLYLLFKEKGVNYLYHANTVSTSLTYFQKNGLLSRGAVEELGLFQTKQSSDELDKVFDVWNDIFLDTVDLHGYFPRQNLYGPVLFELNVDLVLNEDYEIWITKNNPIYWNKNTTDKEKYFESVEELEEKWNFLERQRKMTTIRNNKNPILFEHINKIILDDPRVKLTNNDNHIHLFNEARKAIKNVVDINISIRNKFTTRVCNNCFCTQNYLNNVSVQNLKRLFLHEI
ncbi:hypothetical protein [[Flexibacter] sp. ATCC 35103]|uniref:hypothetical protein n=1 Tax=[Flexibacter] sp. ATCC 35103 TaxID=1937528 RepID=UPI0009C787C0|nr:hypothetical protein [[Flexibacter] sp. ATCC 35103]OMQ11284.1 hypothetical protein BXU01_13265 [[Flexibacter] sp. ATCC 35103]